MKRILKVGAGVVGAGLLGLMTWYFTRREPVKELEVPSFFTPEDESPINEEEA